MRRKIRMEPLEKRCLLAVGAVPVDASFAIDTVADGVTIQGNALVRFDAVILNPELNGPEDVNLTNVQVSSSGQLGGVTQGVAVSGSWQSSPTTPALDVLLDPVNDVLLVESVGPDHIPGTVQGTLDGLPIASGTFKATLGSAIDFDTRQMDGAVTIDISGNIFGSPFNRSASAPFSVADVVPPSRPLPDPNLQSISGRAFLDDNGNGIRDPGEEPATGVVAVLQLGVGSLEMTPVDADGFYSFYNLTGGPYAVRFEDIPAGTEFSPMLVGSDATIDSDVDPATQQTGELDFSSSLAQLNIDVGLRPQTVSVEKVSTIGLYQPDVSLFHLKNSFTPGASDQYFAFGPPGDAGWIPLAGDWNGDGVDTIGLYQPDISLFHLKDSFTPGASDQYFAFGPGGNAGWIPLAGDWNGDGVDTIGLYQPDISLFHLKDSFTPGASDHYFAFGPGGNAGWVPLVGDWDGDGTDTIGLYQPDISLFHLKDSFTPGASDQYFAFGPGGNAGWTPMSGDWNGDGTDTIGLYQPDISLFHLKDTFTPGASDQYFAFGPGGSAGWVPLSGDWDGPGAAVAVASAAPMTVAGKAESEGALKVSEITGVRAATSVTSESTQGADASLGRLAWLGADDSEDPEDDGVLQLLDEALAAW